MTILRIPTSRGFSEISFTPSVISALSDHPEIKRRQLVYLGLASHLHYTSLVKALNLLKNGWADVFFVSSVTRNSPGLKEIPPELRWQYTVEIRPAKSGKWSKPAVYRAFPDAAEEGRLGVTGPIPPPTEALLVAADRAETYGHWQHQLSDCF